MMNHRDLCAGLLEGDVICDAVCVMYCFCAAGIDALHIMSQPRSHYDLHRDISSVVISPSPL